MNPNYKKVAEMMAKHLIGLCDDCPVKECPSTAIPPYSICAKAILAHFVKLAGTNPKKILAALAGLEDK